MTWGNIRRCIPYNLKKTMSSHTPTPVATSKSAIGGSFSARPAVTVHHDPDNRQFFAIVDEGHRCELHYHLIMIGQDTQVLDLTHTFVPETLRGRGLAAALVDHAFDYAREHNMKIRPTCTYISDTYLPRYHHEAIVKDLLL